MSYFRRAVPDPVIRTVTYALLGLTAATAATLLGYDPWTTRSALGLSGLFAMATSIVMGGLLAGATVAASRVFVRTHAWARRLHADLRPAVRGASELGIALMALASGIGEELVFRGLLVPLVGIGLSSLAFGMLHQVRGRARWAWAAWATCMGVAFAAIFALTGSLAGPVFAHVSVNFVNLRHLRDHDVSELGNTVSGREIAQSTASARGRGAPSARRA